MSHAASRVFLTAEWRHLAILNYPVDPALLKPRLPRGTELDFWEGRTYVSMVGFLFLNTRILGLPVPFHRHFEEINLRFYVRRKAEDGNWRRAVVFIREIVPRSAIAFVARALYNEPYVALPTKHQIQPLPGRPELTQSVQYSWRFNGANHFIRLVAGGSPLPLSEGSEAHFIAEHYWGYTAQSDGSTLEYQVEHPPWRVSESAEAEFKCDVAALYGRQYADVLSRSPSSAFLAEGSPVKVHRGKRLKAG